MDGLDIIDWIGTISTIVVILSFFAGVALWLKGIFPVLYRLGHGLAKRKIAIFAKGDALVSLKGLISDSQLFNDKNMTQITTRNDFGKAEEVTLFLVHWPDWKDDLKGILNLKKDGAALIVYAPQELGRIPEPDMHKLNEKRNVIVTNFRGRLMNDIITSMITTSQD